MKTPVLLVDTELLYAAGVASALERHPDMRLGAVFHTAAELEAALPQYPHAVLLIAAPFLGDLQAFSASIARYGCRVVLLLPRLGAVTDEQRAHVHGVVRRSDHAALLLACLRSVAQGRDWTAFALDDVAAPTVGARLLAQLTPRQVQVLAGVSHGAKNAEIARNLGTSEQVVKNLLGQIYNLTGVSDRLELALFVLHHPELARAAGHTGDPES